MSKKDKLVPDELVKQFPQYTRRQLYFMLFPFWSTVSDRLKKKKHDVSAVSITVPGVGRFEFKSSAIMRKTAAKFKRRYNRKMKKHHNKKELQPEKLLY